MDSVNRNRATNLFVMLVGGSILPLLYLSALQFRLESIFILLFWIVLFVLSDIKPLVRLEVGSELNHMTMLFVVQLCLVLLLKTNEALIVTTIGGAISEVLSRKAFKKIVFNIGQLGLTVYLSSLLFHSLKLSPPNVLLDIITDLPALVVAVSMFWIINTFLVSCVICIVSGSSFLTVFFSDFRGLIRYYFSSAPISVATALFYEPTRPYIILIMIPPVIMIYNALQKYFSLHEQTYETIKVLAQTIDERDEYTSVHSTRVAEYAKKIAEHLHLPLNTIQDIEMAGQVHDLGKISIEDKILKKPGKLTEKEFKKISEHPATAYKLLNNLKPYKNGAEYVLYHHERYDGGGYPDGIAGKIIPLGARILAVADSYDAMTSDRPYRKALTPAEAIEELRRNSGTQFDQQVVDAFVEIMKVDSEHKEEVQVCS